jgi:hypothetical protein
MKTPKFPPWGIVNSRDGSIVYGVLESSPRAAWKKLVELELLGTGHTRKTLRADGWRPHRMQAMR